MSGKGGCQVKVSATVFNLVKGFRNGISKNVLIVRGSAQRREENYAATFKAMRSRIFSSSLFIGLTSGGFIFFFFFSDCFGLYLAFLERLRW